MAPIQASCAPRLRRCAVDILDECIDRGIAAGGIGLCPTLRIEARARVGRSRAATSANPRASAIAEATNVGSRIAANGTNTTRVVPSSEMVCANSSARRLLPTPPGPSRVTRRVEESAKLFRDLTAEPGPPNEISAGVGVSASKRGPSVSTGMSVIRQQPPRTGQINRPAVGDPDAK